MVDCPRDPHGIAMGCHGLVVMAHGMAMGCPRDPHRLVVIAHGHPMAKCSFGLNRKLRCYVAESLHKPQRRSSEMCFRDLGCEALCELLYESLLLCSLFPAICEYIIISSERRAIRPSGLGTYEHNGVYETFTRSGTKK